MLAPIIPGLNDHEIPELLRHAALHGAASAAHTIVRLNGSIGEIFRDWLTRSYPDRAKKVLNQIAACHGGKISDSTFGRRMTGEGKWAETIGNLFRMAKQKYMKGRQMKPYNYDLFCTKSGKQLNLF
ncbi:MAG: radical SAM protein, partial [Bacteroidota bacterium]|nr:radical SAM protein [Bacteroidota bacterium]